MAESKVPWPSAGRHKTLLMQWAKLCWRPPDGTPAEARGKQVAWGPEPKACCVASIQSHPCVGCLAGKPSLSQKPQNPSLSHEEAVPYPFLPQSSPCNLF